MKKIILILFVLLSVHLVADYTISQTGRSYFENKAPFGQEEEMADTSTREWGIGGRTITCKVTRTIVAAGNYAAEDVISDSASAGTVLTFDIGKNNGAAGYITKASILYSTTALAWINTLYLYASAPTSGELDDNKANTSVHTTDRPSYLGKIELPATSDLGGNSETEATPSTVGNLPLAFNCDEGDRNIYGILVTADAETGEGAGMTAVISLTSEIQ